MQKNMKSSSTVKTIVVRLTDDDLFEFEIDTNIFDDPIIEAVTRAIEVMKTKKHAIIKAVAECWDKKHPKKVSLCNTYWILVNAACYKKAELLREKFKMQTNKDLAKLPIYGRSN